MSERSILRDLYNKIPSFNCKPGCTDCCGPVPVTPKEARKLGIPGKKLTPTFPLSTTCAFSNPLTGCLRYEKRPFLCRLFGAADVQMLRCPHKCAPDTLLSEDQAKEMTDEYLKLIDK